MIAHPPVKMAIAAITVAHCQGLGLGLIPPQRLVKKVLEHSLGKELHPDLNSLISVANKQNADVLLRLKYHRCIRFVDL